MKATLAHITNHRIFTIIIVSLILINAILVGIETYPNIYSEYRSFFWTADRILLWIFTIEILMRFFSEKKWYHFFGNSWNWFDFIIVAAGHIFVGAHFVTVLRILRVLRVFRAISVIPSLRRLVDALLMTIPALGNIMLLMGIVFYIFAVIGTMLFQHVSPEYFGNLQLSLLTLFQVVTLESWASQVMRPIFNEISWSWIYFVSFVLVGTFVVFNLFIGVIVSNVDKTENAEADQKLANEVQGLREEIKEMKELLLVQKK